jgi:hypothetical protein
MLREVRFMLREVKFTLYEVLGYLLPGAVLLAALVLLTGAIYFPDEPLSWSASGAATWVGVLTLAYLAGHLAQGLSNGFLRLLEWPWNRLRSWAGEQSWLGRQRWFSSNEQVYLAEGSSGRLPAQFLSAARTKAAKLSGVEEQALTEEWLFRICDEALVQRGNLGDREVFVYREGFYRGLCFALVGFAAGLLARMVSGGTAIATASGVWKLGSDVLAFWLVFCLVFVYCSYQGFRHFGRYRISHVILAVLVMPEDKKLQSGSTPGVPLTGSAGSIA